MPTFVAGATGATGRLLVRELLARDHEVRAVVRARGRLPDDLRGHPRLVAVEADLLDLDDAALAELTAGCTAVASCLGHRPTVGGLWGPPRRLVTDAVRRLAAAVRAGAPSSPVRLVLMNSSGVRNEALDPPARRREKAILALLRALLPPHLDNERAAAFVRAIPADDPHLRWAVVRPDTLTDGEATDAAAHPATVRSPLLDPGKVARATVARFMADLVTDDALWHAWEGRSPVLYDAPATAGQPAKEASA